MEQPKATESPLVRLYEQVLKELEDFFLTLGQDERYQLINPNGLTEDVKICMTPRIYPGLRVMLVFNINGTAELNYMEGGEGLQDQAGTFTSVLGWLLTLISTQVRWVEGTYQQIEYLRTKLSTYTNPQSQAATEV